jgi:hypothetical protein
MSPTASTTYERCHRVSIFPLLRDSSINYHYDDFAADAWSLFMKQQEAQRNATLAKLAELRKGKLDVPLIINGKEVGGLLPRCNNARCIRGLCSCLGLVKVN